MCMDGDTQYAHLSLGPSWLILCCSQSSLCGAFYLGNYQDRVVVKGKVWYQFIFFDLPFLTSLIRL